MLTGLPPYGTSTLALAAPKVTAVCAGVDNVPAPPGTPIPPDIRAPRVRKEEEYFDDIPDEKIPKDMLELASHIVETKAGHFEPEKFEDQYEDALKELIRKKQSGQPIERPERREPSKVINLMDALRRSVDASRESAKRAPSIKSRGSQSERPKKKKSR